MSLRSGAIFAPVTVMKPVMRGSLRPRDSTSPSSRWNSCATRAGRSWVEHLELAAVHGGDEVRHLVERLVDERVIVPDGGHAHDAALPEVVVADLGHRDVE